MFAYNELSDLLSGELVVPLKKEGENIICLNKNHQEVIYTFDDFDFDKTIEERSFIIEDDSSDSSDDDSSDSSDDESEEYNFDTNKEKWLPKSEAIEVALSFGYKPKKNINVIKEFEIIV